MHARIASASGRPLPFKMNHRQKPRVHVAAAFAAQIAYVLIPMTEWLILMLLVPVIVAPAVLFVGFSGCSFEGGGVATPVIDSAIPQSDSVVALTWHYTVVDRVQFKRTKFSDSSEVRFETSSSPHNDTGLQPATRFDYEMRGVLADGELGSLVSPVVSATTPGFSILAAVQDGAFGNVDGKTAKCEIAVPDLTAPSFAPTRMWITLAQRSAAAENISFSRVFIGHKATVGDPWDAAALTQILFGGTASTVVAPGATIRSDEIAFAWDRTSALILSMYFSGGPNSDALSARTTGSSNTHLKDAVDEAATADAAGYLSFPGFLSGVVKIEVA